MPVQKIPYAHRFGIISTSYKEKIEKDILERQQQDSDRASSVQTTDHRKWVTINDGDAPRVLLRLESIWYSKWLKNSFVITIARHRMNEQNSMIWSTGCYNDWK